MTKVKSKSDGLTQPIEILQSPDALLKIKTVVAVTGLSETTIRRKIQDDGFPEPVKYGTRCTRWRAIDITEWLKRAIPGALMAEAAPRTTTAPTGNVAPFGLRMLPELREKIEAAAKASGRSMNAEVVARLDSTFSGGRDLRDYFAAKAMVPLIGCLWSAEDPLAESSVSDAAYQLADAMLKARDE